MHDSSAGKHNTNPELHVVHPTDTRRGFKVYKTSIRRRRIDVL